NEWKYTGTTNPDEPVSEYRGNAESFSLTLTPVEARTTSPQECTFCKEGEEGDSGEGDTGGEGDAGGEGTEGGESGGGEDSEGGCSTSVSTGPDTDLVVSDGEGHKAGVVNGKAFSNIPGALVLQPRSQGGLNDDSPGATVIMPSNGGNLSATVKGEGGDDVLVTGCGGFQEVEGMSQEDGEPDTIEFPDDASEVTLDVDPDETLEVTGGFDNPEGEDLTYNLSDVTSEEGSALQVGADPETGEFNANADGEVNFDATFKSLDQNGETSEQTFTDFTVTPDDGLSTDLSEAAKNEDPAFYTSESSPDWNKFASTRDESKSTFNQAVETIRPSVINGEGGNGGTDGSGTDNPAATDAGSGSGDATDVPATDVPPAEPTVDEPPTAESGGAEPTAADPGGGDGGGGDTGGGGDGG
ncbi:MAG TPA: hypothetical protein VHL11_24360, partial [Phototrophicaceae bacterium]|nr:hypothetical protein [Phototrophicaceae bacterium]